MHLSLHSILLLLCTAHLAASFTYLQCAGYWENTKLPGNTLYATGDSCDELGYLFPGGVVRVFGQGGDICCQARDTPDDKAGKNFAKACRDYVKGLHTAKSQVTYKPEFCPGSCGAGC